MITIENKDKNLKKYGILVFCIGIIMFLIEIALTFGLTEVNDSEYSIMKITQGLQWFSRLIIQCFIIVKLFLYIIQIILTKILIKDRIKTTTLKDFCNLIIVYLIFIILLCVVSGKMFFHNSSENIIKLIVLVIINAILCFLMVYFKKIIKEFEIKNMTEDDENTKNTNK